MRLLSVVRADRVDVARDAAGLGVVRNRGVDLGGLGVGDPGAATTAQPRDSNSTRRVDFIGILLFKTVTRFGICGLGLASETPDLQGHDGNRVCQVTDRRVTAV